MWCSNRPSRNSTGWPLRAGFDCKVTASFLESGRTLANAANAAAVIAGIGCFSGRSTTAVLLGLSLAAWAVESWYAVRVAIDRSLFVTLAQEPADGADWLDVLLVDWKLIKAAKSRNMTDRMQGAMRLWRIQGAALVLQLAALAGAIVVRAVSA